MATIDSSVDYVDFSCKCEEQTLTRLDSKALVRGQAYKILIEFTVSGEWEEMTIYARFQTSDGKIYETAFEDGKVLVPHEATDNAGTFAMALKGVHSSGRIITSTPVTYTVQDTIVGDAENPSEPTPGLLDSVMAAARNATTAAKTANDAVTDLQAKVTAGDFNGTDGEKGDTGEAAGFGTPTATAKAAATAGVTVTAEGPNTAKIFNFAFDLPQGEQGTKGDTGEAAGFGTPLAFANSLTTGSAPTVSVSASGEDTAKVFTFNFGIPTGPAGTAATVKIGTVTELDPGATPTVKNSGTTTAAVLDFGIPGTVETATTTECENAVSDVLGSDY